MVNLNKKRCSAQVSPEFITMIKKIQGKALTNGFDLKQISVRNLSEMIAQDSLLVNEIEKKVLNIKSFDINIKFDRRRR